MHGTLIGILWGKGFLKNASLNKVNQISLQPGFSNVHSKYLKKNKRVTICNVRQSQILRDQKTQHLVDLIFPGTLF